MAKLKKQVCEICGEADASTLEKHHIVERTEKNTNHNDWNLAIICANCHSKVHYGVIKIVGLYPSTQKPYGRTLVYERNGESNVPGIKKPYYVPEPDSMKVYYGERDQSSEES